MDPSRTSSEGRRPSSHHHAPSSLYSRDRPLGCLEGSKGPASRSSHRRWVSGSLEDRSWQPSPADPRLHAQPQGSRARLPPSNPDTNAKPLGSRHKAALSARSRYSPCTPTAVTAELDSGSTAWGGLLSWVARGRSSGQQAAGLSATKRWGTSAGLAALRPPPGTAWPRAGPPNLPGRLTPASRAAVVRRATQPSHDGHRVCPGAGRPAARLQEAPPQEGRDHDLAPPTHFRGNRLQMPGSP